MTFLLILLPLCAALVAYLLPNDRQRARLMPVTAILHLALLLTILIRAEPLERGAHIGLDALGSWVLLVIDTAFTLCAFYAPAYLSLRAEREQRVFVACFLSFLGLASLVASSLHPGLLWVAMEASTLATTPLIYFNKQRFSLEATWKYLLICSVGIALALLGTFFIAFAAQRGGLGESLLFTDLARHASMLREQTPWLKAGFVLLLVGYGTKMGLAPLHTWKPDAYGESPGVVGALLATGVTSCAFLAILRFMGLFTAAGLGDFSRQLLVGFGLLSMTWALAFMVRQNDFKRLLAYSSVEHMGILVLGVGLGGPAIRLALYHLAANALLKCVLFLSSGNIHRAFSSKLVSHASGAIKRVPASAWLFMLGFLGITGSPPFAAFVSLFGITAQAVSQGRWWIGSLFLLLLAMIFVAMGSVVLNLVQGEPSPRRTRTNYRDTWATTAPIALALGLALVLGLWLPSGLGRMLDGATWIVEGWR